MHGDKVELARIAAHCDLQVARAKADITKSKADSTKFATNFTVVHAMCDLWVSTYCCYMH